MVAALADRIEDGRFEPRDPVLHRTRGASGEARFAMLVVNLSPNGLMARCDQPLAPDDPLRVELPIVGTVAMRVRWSLAGRIGCQFDAAISPAAYARLVAMIAV